MAFLPAVAQFSLAAEPFYAVVAVSPLAAERFYAAVAASPPVVVLFLLVVVPFSPAPYQPARVNRRRLLRQRFLSDECQCPPQEIDLPLHPHGNSRIASPVESSSRTFSRRVQLPEIAFQRGWVTERTCSAMGSALRPRL